jgi:UDP-galactopyranose mutase
MDQVVGQALALYQRIAQEAGVALEPHEVEPG